MSRPVMKAGDLIFFHHDHGHYQPSARQVVFQSWKEADAWFEEVRFQPCNCVMTTVASLIQSGKATPIKVDMSYDGMMRLKLRGVQKKE